MDPTVVPETYCLCRPAFRAASVPMRADVQIRRGGRIIALWAAAAALLVGREKLTATDFSLDTAERRLSRRSSAEQRRQTEEQAVCTATGENRVRRECSTIILIVLFRPPL